MTLFNTSARLLAVGLAMVALSACATMGGGDDAGNIPADAVASTRVLDSGDEVTEYRVAGQLRTVRVKSAQGPTYYLQDRDGDGRLDSREGPISPVYFKLFEWN